jgi:hypothetical protein
MGRSPNSPSRGQWFIPITRRWWIGFRMIWPGEWPESSKVGRIAGVVPEWRNKRAAGSRKTRPECAVVRRRRRAGWRIPLRPLAVLTQDEGELWSDLYDLTLLQSSERCWTPHDAAMQASFAITISRWVTTACFFLQQRPAHFFLLQVPPRVPMRLI